MSPDLSPRAWLGALALLGLLLVLTALDALLAAL